MPEGVTLDGRDISRVLTKGTESPHDELLYFDNADRHPEVLADMKARMERAQALFRPLKAQQQPMAPILGLPAK